MELKGRMSRTFLNVSVLALDLSLVFYLNFPSTVGSVHSRRAISARDVQPAETAPTLVLQSLSLPSLDAFPVVQQPQGESNYVSKNAGEITQFASASDYGNIGLLAHNFLSGKSFFKLTIGQEVNLEYSDGRTEIFVVTEILRYQALDSKSPFSSFRNLSNADEVLSAQEMFERAYAGERHITFQTCIAKYGNASWGRLFVLAVPKADTLTVLQ